MNIKTQNDTGLRPAPGYILGEIHHVKKSDIILLQDSPTAQERDEVWVLEDSRVDKDDKIPAGTRVLIVAGKELKDEIPGRRLVLAKIDTIMAIYDKKCN